MQNQSDSSVLRDDVNPDDTMNSTNTRENRDSANNETTDGSPRALELTPEAPTPTESKSRTAHGHKTTDAPDDEDNSDTEPNSPDSGGEAVAKTRTANIQAEQSQAARASAVAHRYSGTDESSLSSDPNAPAGRGANSAAQNSSNSQLTPSSDAGCRCNTVQSANWATSRLERSNVFITMLLFVVSGIATILV